MKDGGIFSIGHSTQPLDRFIALLKQQQIDVVADVRSSPFSRYNPQFNRESISEALRSAGIKYAFFGKELGARADDPSCYVNGKVQYSRLASRKEFKEAVERLLKGAIDYRIALMCAEKEPLDCHRTILVSQELSKGGTEVQHIHHDGSLETHTAALERLLDITGVPTTDLFKSKEELLCEALERQESRIAYQESGA
mgnify:CR=1 FL=1